MSDIRISDNTVAVDYGYTWQSMSTAPRGVKLQLLNEGGVAVYSTYNGSDTTWRGWAPLPSKRPTKSILKDAHDSCS